MLRIMLAFVFLTLSSEFGFAEDLAVPFRLTTDATITARTPLWIALPEKLIAEKNLIVSHPEQGAEVVSQRSEDGRQLVIILDEDLVANKARQFEIRIGKPHLEPEVNCEKAATAIALKHGSNAVLEYHTAIVDPPEGQNELYRRSGFIHPFRTPAGKVVTDGFPGNHMHQHGIFAAWTKTFFEGERVDFWNQLAGTGTVEHVETLKTTSGPIFASFQAKLSHKVTKGTPRPVLDEVWTVRLYNRTDVHMFDISSVQTCVAETPLTAAEYHYGGFAVRGSAAWAEKGSHNLITNETTDRAAGNHTRPNWTALTGNIDGQPAGVAMMSHPSNFRSPQPVRLHPSMPYFVYSPAVLGDFDLKPGVPYTTNCRYVAFDGPAEARVLDQLWNDYSQTPRVEWLEK